MAKTHNVDAITFLTNDHREVEQVLNRLQEDDTLSEDGRRRLCDEMIIELVRHMLAEEMHLFPAARAYIPDGDVLADKEIKDHATVERLLKTLENLPVRDRRFEPTLRELCTDVQQHTRDEETRLFVALRESAPAEELRSLGDKIRKTKAVAPTRPRPNAPDTPPLNIVFAPGTGLVDRIRDALSGRGR